MSDPQEPRLSGLMNVRETAAYLGISTHTVYEWKSTRTLAFVKLGRKLMFRKSDLDAFIERSFVPAQNEFALPGKLRKARLSPITARLRPKGRRKLLEKRGEIRWFRTQPAARRRLLKIWKRTHG